MSRSAKLLVILAIALILIASLADAKRRPSRRRIKRPSRIQNLLRNRNPRVRGGGPQESKNVFYYSLPQTTARPPRIILGDELDFSEMGIKSKNEYMKHKNLLSSSPSNIEQSRYPGPYDYYDNDIPVPHPPLPFSTSPYPPKPKPHHPASHKKRRGRRPRTRGPGYRLERPWHDGVVLEHNYKPRKPQNSLAVMPYLRSAGKNLVGAYRAAVLNSAKMAHFTGHAASKYIKGVRNLMGRNSADTERSDVIKLETTGEPDNEEAIVLKEEQLPSGSKQKDIVEVDLTNVSNSGEEEDSVNGVLPKVYLDWGGSFWRFFYNKPGEMRKKSGDVVVVGGSEDKN